MMHVLAVGVDPISLTIGLVVSTALSIGSSVLLGALNRPKSPIADNTAPVLTDRGSPLPMLIGRRRLTGFLCWAGSRQLVKGGGGGKGFGASGGKSQTYFESGWHVLCVGPASQLNGIYESGTQIWTGVITPGDTPSGSHIQTKRGTAYIYWGELDQSADPVLSKKLGTTSCFPGICYVFWNKKNLGGGTQWPVIEYDLTVRIMDPVMTFSDPWLEELAGPTTGNVMTFPTPTLDSAYSLGDVGIIHQVVKVGSAVKTLGADYSLDEGLGEIFFLSSGSIRTTSTVTVHFDTQGDGRDGPNPAHVLYQILTAPAPWGAGMSPDNLDGAGFEALGELLEGEHQTCHLLATGGIDMTDLVAQILTDISTMLVQVGDVLTPVPVREVDASSLPTITDDMLVVPAPPPRDQIHEGILPDRLVFTIPDRANNFRDMDIVIDDDSQASLRNRTKQQQIPIPTVTDRSTGLVVAQRRTQELLTNTEKYSLDVARGAVMLRPGQAFILAGYGQMRVGTVEMKPGTRTAHVEAVIDQYSGAPGTYTPGNIDDVFNAPQTQDPQADIAVAVQELPEALSPTPSLAVLRIRAGSTIDGAEVWVSADGTSYVDAGAQDSPAAGGPLQDDMAIGLEILEEGPVIAALNDDIQSVQDLSGNDAAWRTGAQLAIIDDEICFLRNITAVTGGWRLDGLIRARFDTDVATHSAGTIIYICAATSVQPITSSFIQSGATLYVKTQPTAGGGAVDLSTLTPVALDIASPRALRPLPPDNFVANRGLQIDIYTSGSDIVFTWTYRVKDGSGRAADEVGAGVAIGSGVPTRDGDFQICIFDMGMVLKRTIVVSDDTGTHIYANADLITDFGSEPASFIAQLTDVAGAYSSRSRSITITKE